MIPLKQTSPLTPPPKLRVTTSRSRLPSRLLPRPTAPPIHAPGKVLEICFSKSVFGLFRSVVQKMRFSELFKKQQAPPPTQTTPATPINNSTVATPGTSSKKVRRKGTGLSTTGYTIFSAEHNKIVSLNFSDFFNEIF